MFTENKYELKGSFTIGWIENNCIPSPAIFFKVVIL